MPIGMYVPRLSHHLPPEISQMHIHNLKSRTPGTAYHIIATVEQLFHTPEGHLPRLATLVRNPSFQQRIKRVTVDEAHCICTAGQTHYGVKAFRPSWGRLDQLKLLLPRIPWQAISATFPMHILRTVETKILRPNYVSIRVSCNRPNTVYATHCVHSSIKDPRNYECFLIRPFDVASQPRVLIFFDNTELAKSVSDHLGNKLPEQFRGMGIVAHYHSGMSEQYLRATHSAFTDDAGSCKILCATSGESVVSSHKFIFSRLSKSFQGVDFPDVKIVCNAGLPTNVVDLLQRAGRLGRRDGSNGIFILFYDPWALTININDFYNTSCDDPDRPRYSAKAVTSRKDRAPLSCVQLVQQKTCLRQFFATYLGDTASNGMLFCIRSHND
jgi:superfamily II DNA helicase RecQ